MTNSRSLALNCLPPRQNIGFRLQVEALVARNLAANRQGQIVFVGSSIFRLWKTLAKDLHPLPVVNRAFGGARTWEVLYYADRLILTQQPKIVVYYCGSNDINAGAKAAEIQARFALFAEYLIACLPEIQIFFVSINRAPQKQSKWGIVDAANNAIRQYATTMPNLEFIDVNPVLFNKAVKPRTDLYLNDLVHLTPSTYQAFTRIIRPILLATWEQLS